jgi:two-component system cell cycle sensor histidine kinase/response regulator CckA
MIHAMRGDQVPVLRQSMRRLLGPSARIEDVEAANQARLLAALTLTHFTAALLGTIVTTTFWHRMVGHSVLWGPVGVVLLVCAALILVAYLLVRMGFYSQALLLYLVTSGIFPLAALFAGYPRLDIGVLTTAIFPVAISATLLPYRWVAGVSLATVACSAGGVFALGLSFGDARAAFSILVALAASSVLMVVMRWHHGRLEAVRIAQVKAGEAAVLASEERLRALLGASRDLIVVLDDKGNRTAAFGAVEEVTGYDPRQRGPQAHFEAMHPDDRERLQRELAELIRHPGRVVRTEWRHRHKDGRYRWHEGLVTNRLGQEAVSGIVVNIRDVTERKDAEEAIWHSEQRYRTLFGTVTDGIFLADGTRRLLEVNPAACAQLGYSEHELLQLRLDDIVASDQHTHVMHVLRTLQERKHMVFESKHRRKDGSTLPVEVIANLVMVEGAPLFMGIVRDITERCNAEAERQRLQAQLQHAVKMESIGRLAGGVAHDFNNLLTAILGHVDLAANLARAGRDVHEALDGIREAGRSASTLTRQLLAFSRKQVGEPRLVNMNELILRMHTILERLIGEDVQLRTIEGADLGPVRVDPGLIEQAIINLAVNARDAMPKGGILLVETANVLLDDHYVREHPLARRGRHVRLAISDTGVGIAPEVRDHMFEPFFTTKPRGQGTGLGLAITYGAVQQGGGNIEVYSEPGKGTTFKIYLPVAEGVAGRLFSPSPDEGGTPGGGNETILLVEDDERVRGMAARALRMHGYEVLEASNGEDALGLAIVRQAPIQLLLTDVVMPMMNGQQLAHALAKSHPETRTLFTSGYTENVIALHGVSQRGVAFLGKPYTLDELARRVRKLLDQA